MGLVLPVELVWIRNHPPHVCVSCGAFAHDKWSLYFTQICWHYPRILSPSSVFNILFLSNNGNGPPEFAPKLPLKLLFTIANITSMNHEWERGRIKTQNNFKKTLQNRKYDPRSSRCRFFIGVILGPDRYILVCRYSRPMSAYQRYIRISAYIL